MSYILLYGTNLFVQSDPDETLSEFFDRARAYIGYYDDAIADAIENREIEIRELGDKIPIQVHRKAVSFSVG